MSVWYNQTLWYTTQDQVRGLAAAAAARRWVLAAAAPAAASAAVNTPVRPTPLRPCQVSFSYAAWRTGIEPYSFPDIYVKGAAQSNTANTLFMKWGHGK
jgi:hypothetical protein